MILSQCFCRCYMNGILTNFVLIVVSFSVGVISMQTCILNFVFDKVSNKCIECPDGYFGPNCILACPFPNYGRFCAKVCNCSKQRCDKITGCNQEDSTISSNLKSFLQTTHNYENGQKNQPTKITELATSSFADLLQDSTSPLIKNTKQNQFEYRSSWMINVAGTSPIPDHFKMRTFAEVTRNREDGRENIVYQFTKETRSSLMEFKSVPQSLSMSTTYSKGRTQVSAAGIPSQCPVDYHLKDGNCIPCMVGYFGRNCSLVCPYPSYGHRCLLGECKCSKEYCDPKTGCQNRKQYMQSPSPSVFNLTTFSERTTKYQTKEGHRSTKNKDMGHPRLIVPLNKKPNAKTQNADRIDFDFRTTVLITAGGTFFVTLLLVSIGFQIRSGILQVRRKSSNQPQISIENGNLYAEVQNINNVLC